jgi:hypothetical protein
MTLPEPLFEVLRATGYITLNGGVPSDVILREDTRARPDVPDAIWRDRSGVQIHFKYTPADVPPEIIREARRRAWNTSTAALLWHVSPLRVDVFNAYGRPLNADHEQAYLLRTFQSAADQFAELDEYAGRLAFETGRFWVSEGRVRRRDRVDSQLVRDLRALEQRLIETSLPRRHAQALIGRTLFLCYLRDRGIATADVHPAFAPGSLVGHLQDKKLAYELFDWLRHTFNGDLFPIAKDEPSWVNAAHTQLVAETLTGFDPVKGQGSLWPYRFDVVPVELISSIYEQFAHSADNAEARDGGVHYTPVSLVNLVLDEVLADLDPEARVLDITCGSGVFLVESLRRIVALRARKSPPTRELVREVLHRQICGVDSSEGAIRIAAFSLYLAALELDPEPRPPEALRFDPLIGRTLFIDNALEFHSAAAKTVLRSESFDVIVGNPPWTYSGKAHCQRSERGRPLPARSEDFAFVWRGMDLGRKNARVGVVMRATPFFSRAPASRRAVQALLESLAPVSIVDVSALRDSLFETSDWPAVVLLGRLPEHIDVSTIPVVKVPWTPSFEKTGAFEISAEDIRNVSMAALRSDFPALKATAFGTGRDRLLLNRLRDQAWTLGRLLESLGLKLAIGAQIHIGDGKESSFLIGMPLLDEGELNPVIDASALPLFDRPRCHRPRQPNIYQAPLVIIGEGLSKGRLAVGISARDIVFTRSFYGISMRGPFAKYGNLVAGVLSSSLPTWHALLASSEFGVHKRRLLRQDVLNVPMPSDRSLSSPEAARVSRAIELVQKDPSPTAYAQLDDAVFDLFSLSPAERIVVRDGARRAQREYVEGRAAAEALPTAADVRRYASAFLAATNPWLEVGGLSSFSAQIVRVPAVSALRVVRFIPDGRAEVRETIAAESLQNVLETIGERLHLSVTEHLTVARELRVYVDDEIFIVKPAAARYWAESTGLADADSCLGDSLVADLEASPGRLPVTHSTVSHNA